MSQQKTSPPVAHTRRAARRPAVSFVVIAYNEERTIARCLRSILAQDGLEDFEVVVVDDGSQDATADTVRALAAQHPVIQLHQLVPNQGRGAARAAGVRAAAGKTLALVDADIILPAHWLQTCRAQLATHDAVSGIAVPDGDVSYVYARFGLTPKVTPHSTTVTGSNGLYKRAIFDAVSFDPGLRDGEDVAFNHLMDGGTFKTHSIQSLVVLHKEAKDFAQSLRWLYQTGMGATRQFKQFGQVRVPDISYALFVLLVLAAAAAVGLGLGWWWFAVPVLYVLATSALHLYQKFELSVRGAVPFAAAVFANAVLLACYYAGRTTGIVLARVPHAPGAKQVVVCFDFEGALGMPHKHAAYDVSRTAQQLLAVLAKHQVRATFFVVGKLAEEHPAVIRQLAQGGHAIGVHGYSHEQLAGVSPIQLAQFEEHLAGAEQAIARLTGRQPTAFRAPYLMAPHFFQDDVYRLLARRGYRWASNRELRHPAELFRPGRLSARLAPRANSRLHGALLVLLNVRVVFGERLARTPAPRRWLANWRWLRAGAAPFARGEVRELPLYSPLDCDLLGLPQPSADTPSHVLAYAARTLVDGATGRGPVYNLNFHDWIAGTGNRLAMLDDVLGRVRALPGVQFATIDDIEVTV